MLSNAHGLLLQMSTSYACLSSTTKHPCLKLKSWFVASNGRCSVLGIPASINQVLLQSSQTKTLTTALTSFLENIKFSFRPKSAPMTAQESMTRERKCTFCFLFVIVKVSTKVEFNDEFRSSDIFSYFL